MQENNTTRLERKLNIKFINIIQILFIVYLLSLIIKNKSVEGLTFNNKDFRKQYPTYNIDYNHEKKEFTSDNKTIKYKNLNSKKGKYLMNNKDRTAQYLSKYGLPVPKYVKFIRSEHNNYNILYNNLDAFLNKIERELQYPLVVKPTNESRSKDVHIDIDNRETLKTIIHTLSLKYEELIIQEFTKGDLYRILLVNHKIIDILVRPLPHVIGDGKKTLKQLVEIRNKNQIKQNNKPTTNVNYEFVKKQGVDITNVIPIPKKKKVFIINIPTYHNGTNPQRVNLDTVHKDNIDLFLKINRVLDANVSGIDFICKDIRSSYKENGGTIIEVNSGPSYKLHSQTLPKKNIALPIVKQLEGLFNTA